jgi:hypothetical protein
LRPRLSLQLLLLQFSLEHDHLHFDFLSLTDFFIVGMQLLIRHALDRYLRQHFNVSFELGLLLWGQVDHVGSNF